MVYSNIYIYIYICIFFSNLQCIYGYDGFICIIMINYRIKFSFLDILFQFITLFNLKGSLSYALGTLCTRARWFCHMVELTLA